MEDTVQDAQEKILSSVHQKVLAIAKPIIAVRAKLDPKDEHLRSNLEAALQIWGSACASVSSSRRTNILKQTDPTYLHLVNDPKAFDEKETGAPVRSKIHHTDGARGRGIRRSPEGLPVKSEQQSWFEQQGHRQQPYKHSRGSYNRGKYNQGNSNNRGFSSRYAVISTPVVSCTVGPVGGRLAQFASNWTSVTGDPWLLATVAQGLVIDFETNPTQHTRSLDVMSSERRCND